MARQSGKRAQFIQRFLRLRKLRFNRCNSFGIALKGCNATLVFQKRRAIGSKCNQVVDGHGGLSSNQRKQFLRGISKVRLHQNNIIKITAVMCDVTSHAVTQRRRAYLQKVRGCVWR